MTLALDPDKVLRSPWLWDEPTLEWARKEVEGKSSPSPNGPAQEGKDQSAGGPERPQLDSTDAGAAPRPADPPQDDHVRRCDYERR